MTVLQ